MLIRSRVRRLFLIAAASVAVTLAIAVIPVEMPQSGATSWVASLSDTSRDTYLEVERLRGLPPPYRRALFGTLRTPEERATFWQRVFDDYARRHILSPEGNRVLAEARALATPQLFSAALDQDGKVRVGAAKMAIATHLGDEAAQELFWSAGPDVTTTAALPMIERIRAAWRTSRPTALIAVANLITKPVYAWKCDCIVGSYEVCYYSQTCDNNEACEPDETWPMCGEWYLEPCVSKCTYDID